MNYTVGSSHYLTFAHSTTVHAIQSNVNKKNLKGTSRHSFENYMVVKNLVRKKKE